MAAVCTALGDVSANVLDVVASLLDKSLLQRAGQEGDEPRLVMLETIREFGLECLAESREMEATQHAHAGYYLSLLEKAWQNALGAEEWWWHARLELEYANLRAALQWSVEQGGVTSYERIVTAIRAQLGEEPFATLWSEGRSLTPEQAIAALQRAEMPQQGLSAKPSASYPAGLTPREVEVLRLVVEGLTIAQIAEHLMISFHTANAHVRSIYNKLEVTSRSAAIRYAIEHHLS